MVLGGAAGLKTVGRLQHRRREPTFSQWENRLLVVLVREDLFDEPDDKYLVINVSCV